MQQYLEDFFQAKINIIQPLSQEKMIFFCKNKKYIAWIPHNTKLVSYITNYQYTPKIIINKQYAIQEWIESNTKFDINYLKYEVLMPLHKVKLPMNHCWLQPIEQIWQQLSAASVKFLANNTVIWPIYKQSLPQPSFGNICHGDIHPGNIINSHPYLIDWEWLCIAPKEFDLAMLKQYMLDDAFSILCSNSPTPVDQKLLDEYYKLCLYRCALWALQNVSSKNLNINHNIHDISEFREKLINNTFDYSEDAFLALALAAIKAFNALH